MEAAGTPWWTVASTLVTVLATAALAVFAAVELRGQRQLRDERRRVASARVAATGFLLRRQLRSWLGVGPGSLDEFESWIRDAQRAQALAKHLDIAEARVVEMLATAADADPRVAQSVRSAAVLFFDGASKLNEFVNTPRPHGIEIADWVKLRDIAWQDFHDCIRVLDDRVGIDTILREAQELEARRRAENPSMDVLIKKLAHGLEKLADEQSKAPKGAA